MDLQAVRAFLTIVERGSLAAAADELRVPRSTLSRRVHELEAQVGAPLLRRGPQGVEPTDAGRRLAGRAAALLEQAEAMVAAARRPDDEPRGLLRMVLPIGLPPLLLVPFFAAVRQRLPLLHYRVRLEHDPFSAGAGEADLIVHLGPPPADGRWETVVLAHVRRWLVASPSYLAARGRPERLEDLADHELLAWQAPGADPSRWPLLDGRELPVEPRLVATDIHAVRALAASGLGIALVPDGELAGVDPPGASLETVLTDQVGDVCTLAASAPAALADAPRVRAALELMRAFAARV